MWDKLSAYYMYVNAVVRLGFIELLNNFACIFFTFSVCKPLCK